MMHLAGDDESQPRQRPTAFGCKTFIQGQHLQQVFDDPRIFFFCKKSDIGLRHHVSDSVYGHQILFIQVLDDRPLIFTGFCDHTGIGSPDVRDTQPIQKP